MTRDYTLQNNEWQAIQEIELSAEEQQAFSSEPSADTARVIEEARQRAWSAAPVEDSEACWQIFNSHKLDDSHALIAAHISLPQGSGILNYRKDSEHIQVRF
jgi:hypothetical protein